MNPALPTVDRSLVGTGLFRDVPHRSRQPVAAVKLAPAAQAPTENVQRAHKPARGRSEDIQGTGALGNRLARARARAGAQAIRAGLPALQTMVVRRPGAPEIVVRARISAGEIARPAYVSGLPIDHSSGAAFARPSGTTCAAADGGVVCADAPTTGFASTILSSAILSGTKAIQEQCFAAARALAPSSTPTDTAVAAQTTTQVRRAGTAIVVAAALLLLTNANGLRSWAYDLPESAVSAQLVTATEAWYAATEKLGLTAPKEHIAQAAQSLRDLRFAYTDGAPLPADAEPLDLGDL
ncbi:MAG: hypothetical protein AAFO79_02535 [Pseudomonadota bacterium]